LLDAWLELAPLLWLLLQPKKSSGASSALQGGSEGKKEQRRGESNGEKSSGASSALQSVAADRERAVSLLAVF